MCGVWVGWFVELSRAPVLKFPIASLHEYPTSRIGGFGNFPISQNRIPSDDVVGKRWRRELPDRESS